MKKQTFCLLLFFFIQGYFFSHSLFSQQRELHFVNFQSQQHFFFEQKGLNLAKYCMRWIEENKLPIWQLTNDFAILPMSPDSLEARKQLRRYLPDNDGTLWATDLVHTWIDGNRAKPNSPLSIQFIHFFFAKDSLQNTKSLDNYVFSVKFDELLRLWKQEQQRTLPILAVSKSNKTTGLLFGEVLQPKNDEEHRWLIQELAKAIQQYRLVPFQRKYQQQIPLPIEEMNRLKNIAQGQANDNVFMRVVDSLTSNGLVAKYIDIYTEGTSLNQYQAHYVASVEVAAVRLLNSPRLFVPSNETVVLNLLYHLQLVNNRINTAQINSYNTINTQNFAVIGQQNFFYQTFLADVDLREENNALLFRKNKEVTRLLLQGVLEQKLSTYELNEDPTGYVATTQKFEEVIDKLKIKPITPTPTTVNIEDADNPIPVNTQTSTVMPLNVPKDKLYKKLEGNYFPPTHLYRLQLVSKVIFDVKGQNKSYQIDYVHLVLPAQYSQKGLDEVITTFKATEIQKYFEQTRKAKFKYKPLKKKITYLQGFENQVFDYTIWESSPIYE